MFPNSMFDNSMFDNSMFDNSMFDNSMFDNSMFDISMFQYRIPCFKIPCLTFPCFAGELVYAGPPTCAPARSNFNGQKTKYCVYLRKDLFRSISEFPTSPYVAGVKVLLIGMVILIHFPEFKCLSIDRRSRDMRTLKI